LKPVNPKEKIMAPTSEDYLRESVTILQSYSSAALAQIEWLEENLLRLSQCHSNPNDLQKQIFDLWVKSIEITCEPLPRNKKIMIKAEKPN